LPEEFANWDNERQTSYRKYRDAEEFYLRYSGPGGSNGNIGNAIKEEEAKLIVEAFSQPPAIDAIKAAKFHDNAGFCLKCSAFYCPKHWALGDGSGRCPNGHWASLDPHWSP